MLFGAVLSGLALASTAVAVPTTMNKRSEYELNGVNYKRLDHARTNSSLSYVSNSGICETTEGVNQYSGYLSVGTNMNMWFWFFEARNSASSAPLAIWLNGGPACSSMIGLFQENGPCQFYNGSSEPSLNPYSFNEFANMLYVDQPIGTGFSYGTDDVTSTVTAAPYVWKLLQAFYEEFPDYENRDFGLFTESYGGHYGPEFAAYFEEANANITAGSLDGEIVNLVALGINNGWYDPTLQYKSYIDYAANNSYNTLINTRQYTKYLADYNDDCVPALEKCTSLTDTSQNSACSSADTLCYDEIEGPLSETGNFDVYDVREPSNDPYPPETYATYLTNKTVIAAIGAQSTYAECPTKGYLKFSATGDDSRSTLSALQSVVQSGIQVLIWAGDADFICNYLGSYAVVSAIDYDQADEFAAASLKSYTVNGVAGGLFKTAGNLSYLQVYEAGHEVPYYQPELALQAFTQTLSKKPLSST